MDFVVNYQEPLNVVIEDNNEDNDEDDGDENSINNKKMTSSIDNQKLYLFSNLSDEGGNSF